MALKVYRTPIGFHDAYVAAPSQRAALKAGGSDADLFARGQAELVTDPALTAEPLARPGEVIRRSRGTAAEQLAALPADTPKGPTRQRKPATATPRPDRAALDAAAEELSKAQQRFGQQDAALAAQERALAERRQVLRRERDAALERLEGARDAAQQAYDAAMTAWRAD